MRVLGEKEEIQQVARVCTVCGLCEQAQRLERQTPGSYATNMSFSLTPHTRTYTTARRGYRRRERHQVDRGPRDDHWRSDCRRRHLRLEQWYVRGTREAEKKKEMTGISRETLLDFKNENCTHTHTIDTGKFPLFTDPSPGYHGLKFWEMFGGEKVRACVCSCRYARKYSLKSSNQTKE